MRAGMFAFYVILFWVMTESIGLNIFFMLKFLFVLLLRHTELALHCFLILGFMKLPEKTEECVEKVRGREDCREEYESLKTDL